MRISLLTGFVLITLAASFSCRKQDEVYREFIEGGEITYAHKADSIRVHGGDNRVQITWLRGPDPDVTKAKVYWNNRTDSIETTIPAGSATDTVKVLLEDIGEGVYTFEVITFDRRGNRSVVVDVIGVAYGETFQASLIGRTLLKVYFDQSVHMVWSGTSDQLIGQEVLYKTADGENRIVIPAHQDTLALPAYQSGTPIRYRSLFLPDVFAIDTFYTDFKETKFDVVSAESSSLKKRSFGSGLLYGDIAPEVYGERMFHQQRIDEPLRPKKDPYVIEDEILTKNC